MFTGQNARLLRTLKSVPQKIVALKLGISQPAVSKIERSKNITNKKMERYLKAINFSKEGIEKLKKLLPY